MDQALYDRIYAVFMEAQGLVTGELEPFLDHACAGAPVVRAEVEALLAQLDAPDPFETPDTEDPLRLIGQELDGRYRVSGFVAEGGFSHVYRGRHLAWDLPVAIKLFKRPLTPEVRADLLESFRREGALLARLSRQTTSVVQSFDLSTWRSPRGDEIMYTVIEWLEGAPLSEVLEADRRQWALPEILALLDGAAEALAVAHREGIAHRDVKPDNLFVIGESDARAVKLLDFGVAKVAALHSQGFEATSSTMSPFTVSYAAPEQMSRQHGPTSPRTDVYALALVCVEMLAGRRPYQGKTARSVMFQALDPNRRPTPASLGVSLPPAVEQVFTDALAVDPALRPEHAGALWAQLKRALEDVQALQQQETDAPEKRPSFWRRLRGKR